MKPVKRTPWGSGGQKLSCVNTRNVPTHVRAQFKAYCARRGYTMENAIIALMKKAAREDLKLTEARSPQQVPKGTHPMQRLVDQGGACPQT